MQQLLVVVNRSAGTAADESVAVALDRLRAGADVAVAQTGDHAELEEAVAARGERRLVVVGGDGSVHAVVRALDRTGQLDPAQPLGIVPAGTGNDLAQTLGLSLDPARAADTVLGGAARTLDLLRDDAGGVVVNAAHAGVGARAGAEATRFKGRLGTAAFPLGAAIAGVTEAGWDLRIEVDGRPVVSADGSWTADGGTGVLMLAVCNGPTIAGGTPLAPDAALDDGLAEVVVSTATGPVARAAFGTALVTGRHVEREDVVVLRAREVSFSGPPVDINADGEIQEDVTSRTWRVAPSAWSVLVPS